MGIRRPAPRPLPTGEDLLRRFSHSRKELVQRALSSLVLGHEPAGWNVAGEPTERGRDFLGLLDEAAFGSRYPHLGSFVDEYELRGRVPGERDGWPDQAVVWPERLLLIELKTERASHRAGQCELYLALARHHHPQRSIDLVYITPSMTTPLIAPPPERARYSHVGWDAVSVLVDRAWHAGLPTEQALASFLVDYLRRLDAAPAPSRRKPSSAGTAPPPAPLRPLGAPDTGGEPVEQAAALQIASQVELDHLQRAVPLTVTHPDQLVDARIRLGAELAAGPRVGDVSVIHVRPWIWRQGQSGGKALTPLGEQTGYELRLSYYPSG